MNPINFHLNTINKSIQVHLIAICDISTHQIISSSHFDIIVIYYVFRVYCLHVIVIGTINTKKNIFSVHHHYMILLASLGQHK